MKKYALDCITCLVIAAALIAAFYNVAGALARASVVAEMERRSVAHCLAVKTQDCLMERNRYVDCPDPIPNNALNYWWENRGQANLQKIFSEQFASEKYDFTKLKEWSACKGLLVEKQLETINVPSPSKYGFTLFGSSIPGITHGSDLEIRQISTYKIQVRLSFTYL